MKLHTEKELAFKQKNIGLNTDNPIFLRLNYSCLERIYLDEETLFSSIKYIFLRQEKLFLIKKILDCLSFSVFRPTFSLLNADSFSAGFKCNLIITFADVGI